MNREKTTLQGPPNIEKLDGPWRITFDTNPDDCNLHCVMCEEFSLHSNLKTLRIMKGGIKRRRMAITQIEKIVSNAASTGTLKEIIPSTMGEPLLYKHFETIINLCKNHNVKLNLTTNGTFPRKSASEWAKLIVPVTSDVKISWNGATKETAEQVMKGIKFEKQVSNLKDFISVRDTIYRKGGNFCRITLQLTFMEINYKEFAQIVKLASKIGVNRIKGHHLWTHFDQIKSQSMRRNSNVIKRWNETVEKMKTAVKNYPLANGDQILLDNIYRLDENEDISQIAIEAVCPFLGREAWISWNGTFNPCCAPNEQRKSLGDFGNVNDTSLMEIWGGKKYANLLNNYLYNDLCKTCNMRRPIGEVHR